MDGFDFEQAVRDALDSLPPELRSAMSNVAVVDSNGKPTRVGFRMEGDKKVRYAKKSGEVIDG